MCGFSALASSLLVLLWTSVCVSPARLLGDDGKVLRIPLKRISREIREDVLERNVGADPSTQEDNLRGKPGQGYYVQMALGTPPQLLNILVDTGSSNFAVGAAPHPFLDKYFDRSYHLPTQIRRRSVYVPYTQGNWKGSLGTDKVSLPSRTKCDGPCQHCQYHQLQNFFINGSHWEGILGLAYSEIARPDSTVEPFFDSMVKEGRVPNIFSMQLCGTIDQGNTTDISVGGTMVVGGIDADLYEGPILYSSLRREWYYEVVITKVEVDGEDLGMDCKEYNFDKTIVDSGTTNLRVPKKVFRKVKQMLDAKTDIDIPAEFWTGEDLMCWKIGSTPWEHFPPMGIYLQGTSNSEAFRLSISPQQYMRAVSDGLGRTEDCYKFAITSSDTGTVIGAVVMEGFYVVFDRENKTVGFAKSTCGVRDTTQSSGVAGPFPHSNTTDCAYTVPQEDTTVLMMVAYVMAGICGMCMLLLVVMLGQWQVRRWRRSWDDCADDTSLLKSNTSY
uniref:BACE1 n=1 Tax=Branchiostoma floridae TaxID=7739 RepID=W0G3D1_BRAFL|nr:BACE1 [Branchiostoma floridae]